MEGDGYRHMHGDRHPVPQRRVIAPLPDRLYDSPVERCFCRPNNADIGYCALFRDDDVE